MSDNRAKRRRGRPARDLGVSFVELLVTVVIMGLSVVATMTALSVSIAGSDQHRSKVSAVSELEGAGAYLARNAFDASCTPTLVTAGELNTVLTGRPGAANDGITISVTGTLCTPDGLPQAELTAISDKGDAIETLSVTLGGISVLRSEGSGSSGPVCTWGTLSATPASGVTAHTGGPKDGELKSGASISLRLTFSGPCTGPREATITSATGTPVPFVRDLVQDPLDPLVLNATLEFDEVHWEPDTYTVTVPLPGVAAATFVIG